MIISKSLILKIKKSTIDKNKIAQEALISEIKSTMDSILKENIKKIVGTKEIITKSNNGEWTDKEGNEHQYFLYDQDVDR